MHLFHHLRDERAEGKGVMLRAHAYFDLPDNPVCWLRGHTPRVRVKRGRYGPTWILTDCRVCERRHEERASKFDLNTDWKELIARRVEVIERLGEAEVASNIERRTGWSAGRLELNAELHWRPSQWRHLAQHLSVQMHTGGRGSETPLDAHLDLGIASAYLSIGGIGGRWCEWLGRGHGRDLSLSLHGGQLWWKLWYDGDGGNDEHHRCDSWRPVWWSSKKRARQWMCLRDGHVSIRPLDYLFGGPARYAYEPVGEPRDAFLVPAEGYDGDGPYLIRWQLERETLARPRGPRRLSWTAKWSCHPGIPWRNHDWKGDEFLGGAVRVTAEEVAGDRWLAAAGQRLVEQTTRERERYEYRWPGADHYRRKVDA